jgi:hypothetical protein
MRRPCGEYRQGHHAQSSTERITCVMFRKVPSNPKVHSVRLIASGLIAVSLVATIASNIPVHAVTHRYMPPEPSRLPWISVQTEQELSSAVEFYQRVVAAGGWPKLPGRLTLRPGSSDPNVVLLRKRLKITGDLPAGLSPPASYMASRYAPSMSRPRRACVSFKLTLRGSSSCYQSSPVHPSTSL